MVVAVCHSCHDYRYPGRYIARLRDEVSELGKILDPLADKIGIGIVVVLMMVTGNLSLWYAGVILGRDVLIFAGASTSEFVKTLH